MCDSLRINGTFLLVKNTYPEHHVSINFFYVQQLRLAGKGGKWRRWQFDTAATIAQCCSQTHYNGGCYIRLTARLQYSPQPIRKYREINEEQKLTIMPQNFMPCTQSFSSLSSSQLLSSDFGLRHAIFVSVLFAIIPSCMKRLRSTGICFMNGRKRQEDL